MILVMLREKKNLILIHQQETDTERNQKKNSKNHERKDIYTTDLKLFLAMKFLVSVWLSMLLIFSISGYRKVHQI